MRWYKKTKDGYWSCNHCSFTTRYLMGIQSHIRKHKREFAELTPSGVQTTLFPKKDIQDIQHSPTCLCPHCKFEREILGI